ncbi:hypothetical protein [Diaphorobacter sp.]
MIRMTLTTAGSPPRWRMDTDIDTRIDMPVATQVAAGSEGGH